ncbi:hypothetical protein VTK56DRAFT_5233 [Thermocarpiscus australiensis]
MGDRPRNKPMSVLEGYWTLASWLSDACIYLRSIPSCTDKTKTQRATRLVPCCRFLYAGRWRRPAPAWEFIILNACSRSSVYQVTLVYAALRVAFESVSPPAQPSSQPRRGSSSRTSLASASWEGSGLGTSGAFCVCPEIVETKNWPREEWAQAAEVSNLFQPTSNRCAISGRPGSPPLNPSSRLQPQGGSLPG